MCEWFKAFHLLNVMGDDKGLLVSYLHHFTQADKERFTVAFEQVRQARESFKACPDSSKLRDLAVAIVGAIDAYDMAWSRSEESPVKVWKDGMTEEELVVIVRDLYKLRPVSTIKLIHRLVSEVRRLKRENDRYYRLIWGDPDRDPSKVE